MSKRKLRIGCIITEFREGGNCVLERGEKPAPEKGIQLGITAMANEAREYRQIDGNT
jgi:hypothetical protein